MKYWQTPHFKALQRQWYQRLEASGFEDVEKLVGSDMVLRQTGDHMLEQQSLEKIHDKEAYFRSLAEGVARATFDNDLHRTVMVLRANGAFIAEIVRYLTARSVPRCRITVRHIIRRYEMRWGIRTYTPKQLGKKEAS